MKVTVTTVMSDCFFLLDVAEDLALENFKVCCASDSGISSVEMLVFHHGQPLLEDARTLRDYGIRDGDCVSVTGAGTTLLEGNDLRGILTPSADSSPYDLSQSSAARAWDMCSRELNADTLVPTAPGRSATANEQQSVQNSMSAALACNPETCGTVSLLFVNCQVNAVPLQAFVDSGAPATLMSATCAERCNVSRLIDYSWRGSAQGMGSSRILGRIHIAQLQIEQDFLTTSFTVLERQPLDLLLGLDLLRRHQCLLDLQRNVLCIGTTGTETHFVRAGAQPAATLSAGKPADGEQKDQQNAGDGAALLAELKGRHH